MPADERTDAIFENAKQLLDQLETAIQNKDTAAQLRLAVKLAGVESDFKRIEVGQRLKLALVMKAVRDAKTPEERQQKLLNAFAITADVRRMAQDDLVDDDLSNTAETQLQAIISGLDALEPEGRKALAPFLESVNIDERVCAAVALLALMPDRAIPVLRDLVKNAPGTNASSTARGTLDGLSKRSE